MLETKIADATFCFCAALRRTPNVFAVAKLYSVVQGQSQAIRKNTTNEPCGNKELHSLIRIYEYIKADLPKIKNSLISINRSNEFKSLRFGLLNGDDKTFLDFLCGVFHPEVRDENGRWRLFFNRINELIKKDGYQLYVSDTISSREVYSWKRYSPEDDIFIPFSERNKGLIKNKTIRLKIPRQARYQIYQAINSHNDIVSEFDDTGWRTDTDVKEISFRELRKFYTPKAYDENKNYTEVNSIDDFIQNTSPYNVLDAVESFCVNMPPPNDKFTETINQILKRHKIQLELIDGKFSIFNQIITSDIQTEELGLEELLFEADRFYKDGKILNALEKARDALERLKTFYYPSLDKKKSLQRIINEISKRDEDRKCFF